MIKTISLHLGHTEDGRITVQIVPSDGIEPVDAMEACRRAMMTFQEKMIKAEVQRRIDAQMAFEQEEAAEEEPQ